MFGVTIKVNCVFPSKRTRMGLPRTIKRREARKTKRKQSWVILWFSKIVGTKKEKWLLIEEEKVVKARTK